ncbi:hypothetical protein MTR67_019736 [Solanum verrucosum]|nr:hypothetical protein MTR67_004035 [Solanum verrucosum]WMV26351.1 hypothetical protein MTR67_019736 [Solanum verrucosum]
MGKQLL